MKYLILFVAFLICLTATHGDNRPGYHINSEEHPAFVDTRVQIADAENKLLKDSLRHTYATRNNLWVFIGGERSYVMALTRCQDIGYTLPDNVALDEFFLESNTDRNSSLPALAREAVHMLGQPARASAAQALCQRDKS